VAFVLSVVEAVEDVQKREKGKGGEPLLEAEGGRGWVREEDERNPNAAGESRAASAAVQRRI
jgi:hypothetical protein